MSKALVLGITGMDGKTITHLLLSKGYKVVGTYRRVTVNLKEEIHSLYDFNENLSFEFCDINDFLSTKTLLEKHPDVDEIYLLAAQSHVGHSFTTPNISGMNGMSVYNVLENVRLICPKAKTYFAGTSELFGGKNPPKKGYDESCEYDCRSPYSIGKEMGTRWIKYYRQLGLFACYGVLFNHSNEYRGLDFFVRRVTNAAAKISLGKLDKLKLGNINFCRDEHWADFGCEMMWRMLQNNEPKDYVISTGTTYYGEEYLNKSFGYFNLDWKKYVIIDESRFRPNEVDKLIGNSSLAQAELNWNPNRISFTEHIERMCKWDLLLEGGKKPVKNLDFLA